WQTDSFSNDSKPLLTGQSSDRMAIDGTRCLLSLDINESHRPVYDHIAVGGCSIAKIDVNDPLRPFD
ncbi:MAG: hypothetical protein ACR2PS_13270, partial [Pseudomonadales bacterium]